MFFGELPVLSLLPTSRFEESRIRRRDLLKMSALGSFGLPLASALAAGEPSRGKATAKNCIYIFLCGGPSQLDMWDLKPNAPDSIRGPIKPISTKVPGIQVGDLLPMVAKQTDKLAIVRSMTHGSNSHDTGIMYTLLGDSSPPTPNAYPPTRSDHPGFGGILKALLQETSSLPSWVTLPRPFTTGTRFYKGQTGGFLGPAFDPFFVEKEKKNSLTDQSIEPPSLQLPKSITESRLTARTQLLRNYNSDSLSQLGATTRLSRYYDQAYSMLASDGASRAFNLSLESPRTRDRYGRNEYGQSFLLARRLVEADVRTVNLFWTFFGKDGCQFNLWDNHGAEQKVCGGFNKGIDMLKAPYCCPSFDRAFSALLQDLGDRGLLDETLVVVTGEFGRTPKINKTAGRDHWAPCYSTVLAGGGIRGGQVYGSSDRHAAYVRSNPVRPEDITATMLHAFGFEPETPLYDSANRPIRASKGEPLTMLF